MGCFGVCVCVYCWVLFGRVVSTFAKVVYSRLFANFFRIRLVTRHTPSHANPKKKNRLFWNAREEDWDKEGQKETRTDAVDCLERGEPLILYSIFTIDDATFGLSLSLSLSLSPSIVID